MNSTSKWRTGMLITVIEGGLIYQINSIQNHMADLCYYQNGKRIPAGAVSLDSLRLPTKAQYIRLLKQANQLDAQFNIRETK